MERCWKEAALALMFAGVLSGASPLAAADLLPSVYRDEVMTVRAGLSDLASRVVELGSVQELVIEITYDPEQVSVEAPGAEFFTKVWPPEKGPYLVDWSAVDRAAGGDAREVRATYRFQLLACPDGALTCPGPVAFPVPEFSLDYQLHQEVETARSVRFRPWPSKLLLAPGIPLDEEGKLLPFAEYFPTGAFPEPLSGTISAGIPLALLGAGFVALLGGLLMWPFGSRKQSSFASGSVKRWQIVLQQLENDPEPDESLRYDRLRRCVVWYCTDELGANPYAWVDRSLEPAPVDADAKLIELRGLFLNVLQNEPGQAARLQATFASLSGHR